MPLQMRVKWRGGPAMNQQSQTIAELQARFDPGAHSGTSHADPGCGGGGDGCGPKKSGMDAGKDTGQLAG